LVDAGDVMDGKWTLRFYEFRRGWEPAGHLVPGFGDVLDRARRNGALEGTPFFIGPDGRADALVNAFWRVPGVRGLKAETRRRYAYSLKAWLDFLHAVGVRWDQATRDVLAMFKEWRLSVEDNPGAVEPASFYVDRAAIRRFYLWAALQAGVENPVELRVVGQTFFGAERKSVEGTPSGIRRADVKWLTPEAFRQWRNLGLQGFTRDGLPSEDWKGRTEDRDVAFAEGLFGTGLRLGEWASLLTVELPESGQQALVRGWVASACAKGSVGRLFWMRRRVAQQVLFYAREGTRSAAVARAQRAGRYEQVRDRWLLHEARPDGALRVSDEKGRSREVMADSLAPEVRQRLFRVGNGGLEPAWLWLNDDGMPRGKKSWYKTFDRANARVAKALGQDGTAARLFCRPHMLRHSMCLRWFCIATFVAWQRTRLLTKKEQRDFRNQLGDVWFLLATLLGHRSAETTRQIYLEPFKALDVDQMIALMDADDRAALEQLVDLLAAQEPRVLTGVAG
jgi:integrase